MADELNTSPGEMVQASFTTQKDDVGRSRASKLSSRYRNGYRIGHQLVHLGRIIKIVGFVLAAIAVLIAVAVMIPAAAVGAPFRGIGISLLALLYGAIIVFGWYVGGTVVSGIGQLIVAAFDGAVFNAPFLNDDDRASILSLD